MSCDDLFTKRGLTDDDEDIFADIDPDGFMVGKYPIRVRCFKENGELAHSFDQTAIELKLINCNNSLPSGKVITEISSDADDYIDITPCNSEACFVRDVTYSATLPQMVALIDISKNCRQTFAVIIVCLLK